MSVSEGPIGIILIDHGSKRGEANEMLLEVTALFRRVSGERIVEPAHMELANPTIAQAFERCVAQGARTVVAHPYFLSPGRHSTSDIPRMVAEAASAFPDVDYHITKPLGVDERIARLIIARVEDCVQNCALSEAKT